MKIFNLKILLIWIIFATYSTISFSADDNWQKFTYKVLKVKDGDTAVLTDGNVKFTVRFAGMDAPESGQDYGKVSTNQLSQLILEKEVKLEPVASGLERYGRVLGHVFLGDKDVSLLMVEGGYAYYYRPSCLDYPANKDKYNYDPRPYIEAEQKAKLSHKNIWSQQNIVLPCQYRKEK